MLVDRLIKQGFKFSKLCHTFNKFAKKYSYLLRKYKELYNHDLALLLHNGGKYVPTSLKLYPVHNIYLVSLVS